MPNDFEDIAKDFLTPPDRLIVSARKSLISKDTRAYNHVGMVECKGDELEIRVAPENIDRALRFMDVFIKTLRARHYEIELRSRESYAIVKGYAIKIRCHELSKRVVANEQRFSRTELHPTGLLAFKAGNFTVKEWKENKKEPARNLESQLPAIIGWLEEEADYWNTAFERNRLEQEAEEQRKQAAKEFKELKDAELMAFDRLLADSERWVKVVMLREYIDARVQQGADPVWVHWARNKADWYDPFVGREDEVLGRYGMK